MTTKLLVGQSEDWDRAQTWVGGGGGGERRIDF